MTPQRVLISGAGIAGMGLAHWLARSNHDVTLIDRFESFHARGHFMTLKGACVEILSAMGLYETLKACEWPSTQFDWYTRDGRCLRRVSKTSIEETLKGFLTLRRAHLHKALHDALPSAIAFRMGTEIETIEDEGSRVEVLYRNGQHEAFDLVVGAEGVHSAMRQRHFPEVSTRSLAGTYIVFVVDYRHDLGGSNRTTWGQGESVSLIPLSRDRLGAMIYQDDQHPKPPLTDDAQAWRSYLSDVYARFPVWVTDAISALKPGDEIFADEILMVPATTLVKGRVALLGDAGYCPTFFSGMGAAAALLGAYALTRQLDKHDEVATALDAYERLMVPLARGYQKAAVSGRRRTLARGPMAQLGNLVTARIPETLGNFATRRHYQAEVRMADLA
jgi:2-polyprenyl-6-methoxyphenol hydroxylase-like FAD-dependent oxidoreductase